MDIKRGDTVMVISGNEKGEVGTVQRVVPAENRLVVSGVNIVKKHQKPVSTGGRSKTQPGIIEYEAPIHASKVQVVCPHCHQPTRVGHDVNDNGKRVRVCKHCGADID
jgi:large subunit ribosomal protein L24